MLTWGLRMGSPPDAAGRRTPGARAAGARDFADGYLRCEPQQFGP
jgi:hypothetical protein